MWHANDIRGSFQSIAVIDNYRALAAICSELYLRLQDFLLISVSNCHEKKIVPVASFFSSAM